MINEEIKRFIIDSEMTHENRYNSPPKDKSLTCTKGFSMRNREQFINMLYDPYRIRGNKEELLKDSPKFQYPNERNNGDVEAWGVDSKGFWVIFTPQKLPDIETFAEIQDKEKKLFQLSRLQSDLIAKGKTKDEMQVIKKEIDKLYSEVFEVDLPTDLNETLLNSPFRDKATENLFKYIVQHWRNTNANKWGYIWEFLFTKGYGCLTNKTDFETYIRVNHNFLTGKPNYESCNSEKKYDELLKLHKTFLKI